MFRLRTTKQLRLLGAVCALALSVTALQFASPSAAQAANANDFNPSNIISDANFYNGSAMTAGEVQSFLNARVPRCIIGDAGYAAGSWRGSNQIANQCLKDFKMTTASKAANAYCGAYPGGAGESVAQIIEKVGRVCGISQKVLLVMLEKEQSLVTDTWPYVRQFDVAMGYACPDSGPGNSANCDSAYYGFLNQVYRAAWQLKVYRAHPDSYRYKPFQTNTIQWHPNAGCGTSQVYIENWATAALYIYTPYRPNQAALNAQWGTGDSCSTYGNRNFFMFYSTWFGAPTGPSYPFVDAKYAQNQWLGAPTSGYNSFATNGGGVVRAYENGAITWQQGKPLAYVLTGDFRTYFGDNGGLSGKLGWPTSDQIEQAKGFTQAFEGAAVSRLNGGGFVEVRGSIRTQYAQAALAYPGPIGWPVSNEQCTSAENCTQAFERGSIVIAQGKSTIQIPEIDAVATSLASTIGKRTSYPLLQAAHGNGFVQGHENGAIAWSPDTGAFSVRGKIRTAFGAAGGIAGKYGWPLSEQTCNANDECTQSFLGGTISVDAQGKVTKMDQRISDAYSALKQAGTDLGRSLGDTIGIPQGAGGLVHPFENGAIAVSDRTGAFAVMSPIRETFNSVGGLGGSMGWPTSNARTEAANGGGVVQGFEGGAVTSTGAGVFVLSGKFREKFGVLGGLTGTLGWPQSGQNQIQAAGGGSVQAFQGGALTLQNGTSSVYLVSGDIRAVFNAEGGIGGSFGWPIGDSAQNGANGGGTVQAFQGAAIASSPLGTYSVSGPLRTYFNQQGGLAGPLGWPASAMSCTSAVCKQSFQGGTVVWDTAGGHIE